MSESANVIDPQQVEQAATTLAAFMEGVRLKLHLAGMDARTAWEEELRPELESLEASLRSSLEHGLQAVGEARVQAHLGLMEARQRWEEIEPRVAEAVDRLRAGTKESDEGRVGHAVRELFDAARDAVRGATKPK
jgi:hypothetical protein